jgi:hypothetical protein
MGDDVDSLLARLDGLIGRLGEPVDAERASHGWSEAAAAGVRTRLVAFRELVAHDEALPVPADRPLNLARALDHWGVHGGELLEDLALLESHLRHT